MQIDMNAQSYTEEQAVEILTFLYHSYHGRDVDPLGRETFLPMIIKYGHKGVVYTLYKILGSEETSQRAVNNLKDLWISELGREPTNDDIERFGYYLSFFGENGKQTLTQKIFWAEEKRQDASSLTKNSDPASAEKIINELLREYNTPKSWQLYHELGLSLHRQNKYNDAIEPYKKAILLNTNDDNWIWSCDDLKWAFFNASNIDKIKDGTEFFQNVTNRYPNRWPAWHQLGWFYMEAKDYPKSIECYKRAIELSGNINNWPWSATDLMKCFRDSWINVDEAYKYFLDVSEKYPNNWGIWHALGWTKFIVYDEPTEAIKYYEKAVENHSGKGWVWSWFDMGLCFKKINKRANAQNCFQNALIDSPSCWEAYNELAWGAISLKKWNEVLPYIDNGLAIKSDASALWLAMGDYFRDNPQSNSFFAWLAYTRASKYNNEYTGQVKSLLTKYKVDLRELLEEKFTIENDILIACFDLNIVYENLDGKILSTKIVSLIRTCERENKFNEFIVWMQKKRKNLFPDILNKYI